MFQDPVRDARPSASEPGDDPATVVEPVTPLEPVTVRAELPVVDTRSNNPGTCPFLRSIDAAGDLLRPIEAPDPANRCVAVNGPVPQSLRQQELVCLASGHVTARATCAASSMNRRRLAPTAGAPHSPRRSPARWRSSSAAFALSLAFVVGNGGLVLTAAASPTGEVLAAEATPPPTATPAPTAAPTPTATASRLRRRPRPRHRARPPAHHRARRPNRPRRRHRPDRPAPTPSATPDGEPICAPDRLPEHARSATSTSSGRVTTCSASPSTSACRRPGQGDEPVERQRPEGGRGLRIPPPTSSRSRGQASVVAGARSCAEAGRTLTRGPFGPTCGPGMGSIGHPGPHPTHLSMAARPASRCRQRSTRP